MTTAQVYIHNSDKNVSIQSSSLDTATTKLDHARGLPEFWFPSEELKLIILNTLLFSIPNKYVILMNV